MISRLLLFFLFPVSGSVLDAAEPLVSGTFHTLQTWSQEADYPRPWHVSIPETAKEEKLAVLIFLHGNGGSGERSMHAFKNRYRKIASRYILIFPDGYRKSWNIVSERSVADDRGFIEAIIQDVSARPNVQSGSFTVMGVSNGAALANQIAIETELPNIRNYITCVSQLNTYQHDGTNFKAKGDDNNYTKIAIPQTAKRILNISGFTDRTVPYKGGPSPWIPAKNATLPFVPAEESIYRWAVHMGWKGGRLSGPTETTTTREVFRYCDGDVIHCKVIDQGHGATFSLEEEFYLQFLEGETDP